jgi:BNR/Asp-box repeat
MKKIINPLILVACLLSVICCIGKDEETFINGKISMLLLDGGNQSEVIGKTLTKKIKIQIYKDGKPLTTTSTFAAFKQKNCSGSLLSKTVLSNAGTVEYAWRLDDVIGKQRLVVYAYQNDISLDSLIVEATATDIDKTIFNEGACLPYNGDYTIEAGDNKVMWANKYGTDGLFATSKNSGRSWQVQSPKFTGRMQVYKNEIFWTSRDSIYRSKDGGLTVKGEKIPEFAGGGFTPILSIMPTKIVAYVDLPSFKGTMVSADRGLTWSKSTGVDFVQYAVETASGRLFGAGIKNDSPNSTFFYSDDGGKSWKPTWSNIAGNNAQLAFADNVYVSSSNELYVFSWTKSYAIHKSTDNGVTWSKVSTISSEISNFQEYNNQIYYFYYNTLLKTTDFATSQSLFPLPSKAFKISSDGVVNMVSNYTAYYKAL